MSEEQFWQQSSTGSYECGCSTIPLNGEHPPLDQSLDPSAPDFWAVFEPSANFKDSGEHKPAVQEQDSAVRALAQELQLFLLGHGDLAPEGSDDEAEPPFYEEPDVPEPIIDLLQLSMKGKSGAFANGGENQQCQTLMF
ncbi:hypothetical protein FISHEDRAFT_59784 [Fistulina hepatica ATCC 64428]|uniref:Uncharacterized protein n=1 Tax=Fistulina hepatica ATCC 64428 TaxID=1128425 RepID=A0A0D7AA17_9AGAR|nr:hypothetical protein FISHEDRAFT_59784 [Fistulina hepatica ATCC 64428]